MLPQKNNTYFCNTIFWTDVSLEQCILHRHSDVSPSGQREPQHWTKQTTRHLSHWPRKKRRSTPHRPNRKNETYCASSTLKDSETCTSSLQRPEDRPCRLAFTWWGRYGSCLRHEPTELAHSFCSVLVSIPLFMSLSTVFHSINSPDNSLFSHSVLQVLSLPYWSFQLYVSLWQSP